MGVSKGLAYRPQRGRRHIVGESECMRNVEKSTITTEKVEFPISGNACILNVHYRAKFPCKLPEICSIVNVVFPTHFLRCKVPEILILLQCMWMCAYYACVVCAHNNSYIHRVREAQQFHIQNS